MDLRYFLNKIKDVRFTDMVSFFPFLFASAMKPFAGSRYSESWIVCEEPGEARDNGFWFFKYLTENHPEIDSYYAIRQDSADYAKVSELGKTIRYGSFRHWLAYLACRYNISSQKGGKPNAAMCSFLELNNLIHVDNVFLQHGITVNDARWLYADRSRFRFFITGTRPETEYINERFGYAENVVQYEGFPRFDSLHDFEVVKNRILIMPSWRAWFHEKSSQVEKEDANFEISDYLRAWGSLLQSRRLLDLVQTYDLEVVFYPHRNMQPYLHCFKDIPPEIILASDKEYDIQDLLKTSEMMITDFSSVFFDMVYMKKPVVFYQFDEQKFRQQQYGQGYFDYHNNAFGKTFDREEDVLEELEAIVRNHYEVSAQYLEAHRKTFEKYDQENSKRIVQLLIQNR